MSYPCEPFGRAAGLIAQCVSERASADARGVQSLASTAPHPGLVSALRNDTTEAVHQTLGRGLEGLVFGPKEFEHLIVAWLTSG